MSAIPLLTSSAAYSEASQIIPTVNGVIQDINENALIGSQAPTSLRNTVIGGDFATNPWQRGTTFTSISNTLTYTADRFWALGGASSSISASRQTSGAPAGFGAVAQFGRASSNSDTAAIKFGQVFSTKNSTPYQAVPFVLSFYAKAGANFSAASSALGVTVGYGTGSDESAANYASGSWTGYAGVTLIGSAGTTATTVTVTTSWARYVMAGFIPAAATQIGFNFAFTPVGTAGSNDWVQFAGIQFEQMPQAGVNPTPFERRPASLEQALCQHYTYIINEGAAGVAVLDAMVQGTTTLQVIAKAPVTMRAAPTITVTVGTFKVLKSSGAVQTLTSLTGTPASGSVQGAVAVGVADSAGLVAGNATQLVGFGGAGIITLNAEL